ncbi:LacI family DNA-binding transcriptional regulator [Nonomuraea dietziae]|uniref:LacI family DNA-binding transcriptional regulator n=1 Tax=Nonomuraea dietziae TaxID=65515 RepID=UPI0034494E07
MPKSTLGSEASAYRRIPVLQVVAILVPRTVDVGHGAVERASVDHRPGAHDLEVHGTVQYLAALGHRRIARVAGLPALVHTAIRDRAFTDICQAAGIESQMIEHTDYSGEEGARATRRLITSPDRPTAIVYDNDIMAVAGLSVAQELSMDVPGELSIVAWDDSPLSQVVRPALTALSRDIPAYGVHAARVLMSLIAGEKVEHFEDAAPRLTPRASTGSAAT